MTPRWIDCTLFNGEPIVQLRLEYLKDHVDVFYICEARYTHQGQRKETLYIETHKEWFEPYKAKVKFLVFDRAPQNQYYEREHRDFPVETLLRMEMGPYILSGCDIDEIPDLAAIPSCEEIYNMCQWGGCVRLAQEFYYYNFNWRLTEIWTAPFFINDTLLQRAQSIQRFRYDSPKTTLITIRCGWHFSYFQTVAEIQRKLESFCHAEFNTDTFKNEEHILDCIRSGKDLFKRNKILERADRSRLPASFLEFGRKWLPAVSE